MKMYWRLASMLIVGMLLGNLLETKETEYRLWTNWDRLWCFGTLLTVMFIPFMAGRESQE